MTYHWIYKLIENPHKLNFLGFILDVIYGFKNNYARCCVFQYAFDYDIKGVKSLAVYRFARFNIPFDTPLHYVPCDDCMARLKTLVGS